MTNNEIIQSILNQNAKLISLLDNNNPAKTDEKIYETTIKRLLKPTKKTIKINNGLVTKDNNGFYPFYNKVSIKGFLKSFKQKSKVYKTSLQAEVFTLSNKIISKVISGSQYFEELENLDSEDFTSLLKAQKSSLV